MRISEIIEVFVDLFWNIVWKFENVGVWFFSIDYVIGIGELIFEGVICSERICYVVIKGYDKIYEKLIYFDGVKWELVYELMEGGFKFLFFVGNYWMVIEVGFG